MLSFGALSCVSLLAPPEQGSTGRGAGTTAVCHLTTLETSTLGRGCRGCGSLPRPLSAASVAAFSRSPRPVFTTRALVRGC